MAAAGRGGRGENKIPYPGWTNKKLSAIILQAAAPPPSPLRPEDSMSLITGPVALMRLVTVESVTELDRLLTRLGLPPQDVAVETKFNGWLAQAAGGRLYSRRGKDLTDKFPRIAKLIAPFKKEHLIGELVYFDENGIMQEPAVTTIAGTKDPQEAIRKMREMPGTFEYVVFDLLAVDGQDITQQPTSTRREILDECFCNAGLTLSHPQPLSMLERVYDDGVAAGGDGVVIKNLRAPYLWKPFGQSEVQPVGYWWKLKPVFTDNFVVTGTRRGPKGSLLAILSQYHNGRLVEVTDVNNFDSKTVKEVLKRMEKGPFLVEIAYLSRFPDPPGALQHPRFVRFRDDQDLDSAQLPAKYAPEGGSMGVPLQGYNNYWIKPNGDVIEFKDPETHEMHAREGGFETVGEALDAGWIRGFEYRNRLALDILSLTDQPTFDAVVKFLEKMYTEHGPFSAIIDFALPKFGIISIDPEDLENDSIQDLLRIGLRRA